MVLYNVWLLVYKNSPFIQGSVMIISHLHGFASVVTTNTYTFVSLLTEYEANVTFTLCEFLHASTDSTDTRGVTGAPVSGAIARLRTSIIISCGMSVSPFVSLSAKNNSAPPGRIIIKISYFRTSQKSVEKIQVSLKSDKNSRYFTWRLTYIYDTISMNSS